MIGTVLEHYDALIYAHMLPMLIPLFFVTQDPFTGTLIGFSSYAAGFIMRPLGGVVFGHFGDKLGRKVSLTFSLLLMSLPTILIGVLPSYAVIGILAPILLVIFRLIQSFSVGGETPGAACMIQENTGFSNKNFASAVMNSGIYFGGVLGGLVGFLCTLPIMPAWGWRIPFFIGSILGVLGFYVRRKARETPEFLEAKKKKKLKKYPLWESFKKDRKSIYCAIGLSAGVVCVSNFTILYLPHVLSKEFLFPSHLVLLSTTGFITLCIIAMLFWGYIADLLGRKKIMVVGCLGLILVMPFVLFSFDEKNLTLLFILYSIACFFFAALCAPLNAFLMYMFPTERRFSGSAFSWGAGYVLFGGMTPIICHSLRNWTGSFWGPSFYVIFCQLLALTAIYFAPNVLKNKSA